MNYCTALKWLWLKEQCWEKHPLEACCWRTEWILIHSWYQDMENCIMEQTEEFLKRKWVKVSYFQCSQDCVFCSWGGVIYPAYSCYRNHSQELEQMSRLWHPGKKLVLTSNYFEKRKWKRTKVGKKCCKGCTSGRCSSLLPGPCRPGCAIPAPAPSALPCHLPIHLKTLLHTHSLS